MSKKKRKLLLIGLICLNGSLFQETHGMPVTSQEALIAANGVISLDEETDLDPEFSGGTLAIKHSLSEEDWEYREDLKITITGYQGTSETVVGINAGTKKLTLGKVDFTWTDVPSDTPTDTNIYGLRASDQTQVTLGNNSSFTVKGNTTGYLVAIHNVYPYGQGPGEILAGDGLKITVHNSGTNAENPEKNETNGVYLYHGSKFEAGDDLQVTVTGNAYANIGLQSRWTSLLTVGENGSIDVKGNQFVYGVWAHDRGGKAEFGKNLNIVTDSMNGESIGVFAYDQGVVTLDGATVIAKKNGVIGGGTALSAEWNSSSIEGKPGIYHLNGRVISSGDSTIDLTLTEGSTISGVSERRLGGNIYYTMTGSEWTMTGSSNLTTLDFQGKSSNIIFGGEGYQTLTVDNLTGAEGNFWMRTDIQGGGHDFLNVTGTSAGEHLVTVKNNGAQNVTGDERLVIIQTADGRAQFQETNAVELGGYEFRLRPVENSNTTRWELFSTRQITGTGSAAVNLFGGSYLLNYAETQTLLKRMGDLRESEEKGGVWGRIYGGKMHSETDLALGDFDLNYGGIQVGADKKFVRKDGKGKVYLGGFFGYTQGDLDFDEGKGNTDSKTLGIYWTHMHHNGFYADALFKYGWMDSDFTVRDSLGSKVTGKDISSTGFSGSLEVGCRYHWNQAKKEGWYIEPQAQLTVGRQSGDRVSASNGLEIKVDSFRSVLGRIGTHIGYEVKGGKNPVNLYGKLSVVKEFEGELEFSLNGSPEKTGFKDTWLSYGVGATARLGSRHNLYFDVERATGGQFTQSWEMNGGYRYSW